LSISTYKDTILQLENRIRELAQEKETETNPDNLVEIEN
jgi:hypothetical protein